MASKTSGISSDFVERRRHLPHWQQGGSTYFVTFRSARGPLPEKALKIVADVADGHRIVDEEQFGPILPVIRFDDIEAAVASANGLDLGLGGSVWGEDRDLARSVAERIESGTVWINKHADLQPHLPFGGAKLSGVGSELGEEGLKEFTQVQVLNMAR